MKPDLITQLRDIHNPPAIPVWPLAIGWYIVIVLVLIALSLLAYNYLKKWHKRRLKKLVLNRLQELQTKQAQKHEAIAEELSALLKRAALARFPRQQVAGLYAESWLQFLDQTGETTDFSTGPGRLLIDSPYKSKHVDLPEQLFHLIKNWVKKNL